MYETPDVKPPIVIVPLFPGTQVVGFVKETNVKIVVSLTTTVVCPGLLTQPLIVAVTW